MAATSRIVVGVDDTEEAETALRWAVDQAALTGGRVDVVYAWQRSHLVPVRGAATITVPDEEYQAVAEQFLADLIAKLALSRGVEVCAVADEGEPDEVLARRAQGAQLLVVGSPGVGRIAGLLSGSAPYAIVRDAPCPLVIVPLPSDQDAAASTRAQPVS